MSSHSTAHEEATRASDRTADVLIVGGGVSGLTAGVFTARAGLETLIVNDAESILRRNAHLENFPGFPAGVNSRLFLELLEEQARRAGCELLEGRGVAVERVDSGEDGGFRVVLEDGEALDAERVIAASWSDASYLDGLDVDLDQRGTDSFVVGHDNVGPRAGHTGVDGLYVAGRLSGEYHQTVVSAGNGAQVALTLIHDSRVPLYNDWVAPEGYFTDRGMRVPPGIEEITEEERRERERESMRVMQGYFSTPHSAEPTPHPSLAPADPPERPRGSRGKPPNGA
jgi:thioredoxin reductase